MALRIGLLVGVLALTVSLFAYFSASSEVESLKNSEAQLSDSNKALEVELAQLRNLKDQSDVLEAELSRMSLLSASGGGINMKMMPHPETGEATVELPEVFSFDANHAFCRVDTNRHAFIMPTYQMGDILIEKNEFFMAMSTTTINEFRISQDEDGNNKIVITGGLDCFTEVAKATMTMGSREVAEPANYKIQATDGGLGGGPSGDTFEFTAYFDPNTAPINYAIFGPEFTFTGEMVDGEITIPSPR